MAKLQEKNFSHRGTGAQRKIVSAENADKRRLTQIIFHREGRPALLRCAAVGERHGGFRPGCVLDKDCL